MSLSGTYRRAHYRSSDRASVPGPCMESRSVFGWRVADGHLEPDSVKQEPRRSLGMASLRHEHVDDLAVLVDSPVDIPPAAGDLHVGLVNEPTVAGAMPTWSGRVQIGRA